MEAGTKVYGLYNRDGEMIKLPGHTSVEDLIKMGVTQVGFKKPDKPIGPDEWCEAGAG